MTYDLELVFPDDSWDYANPTQITASDIPQIGTLLHGLRSGPFIVVRLDRKVHQGRLSNEITVILKRDDC